MTTNKQQNLDEILSNYEFQVINMKNNDTGIDQHATAKTAIREAIEQIIGEADSRYDDMKRRSDLRAEQRTRLDKFIGGEENE